MIIRFIRIKSFAINFQTFTTVGFRIVPRGRHRNLFLFDFDYFSVSAENIGIALKFFRTLYGSLFDEILK